MVHWLVVTLACALALPASVICTFCPARIANPSYNRKSCCRGSGNQNVSRHASRAKPAGRHTRCKSWRSSTVCRAAWRSGPISAGRTPTSASARQRLEVEEGDSPVVDAVLDHFLHRRRGRADDAAAAGDGLEQRPRAREGTTPIDMQRLDLQQLQVLGIGQPPGADHACPVDAITQLGHRARAIALPLRQPYAFAHGITIDHQHQRLRRQLRQRRPAAHQAAKAAMRLEFARERSHDRVALALAVAANDQHAAIASRTHLRPCLSCKPSRCGMLRSCRRCQCRSSTGHSGSKPTSAPLTRQ